jgi:hypothetical protein
MVLPGLFARAAEVKKCEHTALLKWHVGVQ